MTPTPRDLALLAAVREQCAKRAFDAQENDRDDVWNDACAFIGRRIRALPAPDLSGLPPMFGEEIVSERDNISMASLIDRLRSIVATCITVRDYQIKLQDLQDDLRQIGISGLEMFVQKKDAERFAFVLPIVTANDDAETNRRTMLLAVALSSGLDGRAAIDDAILAAAGETKGDGNG